MPYKDGGMAIKADRMRKRRLVDRKRLGRVSVLHSEQVRSGGEGTILELMGGYERKDERKGVVKPRGRVEEMEEVGRDGRGWKRCEMTLSSPGVVKYDTDNGVWKRLEEMEEVDEPKIG